MEKIQSTKIKELYNQLVKGNNDALDNFWEEAKIKGLPLIENIQGDDRNVNITFVYKAKDKVDIDNVVIYGAFPSYRYKENLMEQLLDSNLWFKTYKVRNDIKFFYNFSVNDFLDDDYNKRSKNLILDEFNPNTIVFPKDDEDEEDIETKKSLVTLCNVKPDIWTKPMKGNNSGTINMYRFNSKILNNTRRVCVYKPYEYKKDSEKYNLIICTDGFIHINIINAKNVLDNLMNKNLIQNSICVFVDNSKDRFNELTCNEKFSDFIGKELIPWIYSNYNVSTEPEKTTISGISLGGLTAVYLAFKSPEIFGNVLAQSGSFWWNDEWLIEKCKNTDIKPLKVYLNAGILEDRPYDDEPVMKECIEKMREVLLSKGHTVFYERFPSGHDYLGWGEKFATGLMALMGKKSDKEDI